MEDSNQNPTDSFDMLPTGIPVNLAEPRFSGIMEQVGKTIKLVTQMNQMGDVAKVREMLGEILAAPSMQRRWSFRHSTPILGSLPKSVRMCSSTMIVPFWTWGELRSRIM